MLDTDLLRREQPDVMLTQDLCRVCAVPSRPGPAGARQDRPAGREGDLAGPEHPRRGHRAGRDGREAPRSRTARPPRSRPSCGLASTQVKEVGAAVPIAERVRPRMVRPAVRGGHWVPEMVEAAAGATCSPRRASLERRHRMARDPRRDARGDRRSCRAATTSRRPRRRRATFLDAAEFADTPAARNGNVFAVDATSYFSRPGPRMVDGLEILAWATNPDIYPAPPDGTIVKLG